MTTSSLLTTKIAPASPSLSKTPYCSQHHTSQAPLSLQPATLPPTFRQRNTAAGVPASSTVLHNSLSLVSACIAMYALCTLLVYKPHSQPSMQKTLTTKTLPLGLPPPPFPCTQPVRVQEKTPLRTFFSQFADSTLLAAQADTLSLLCPQHPTHLHLYTSHKHTQTLSHHSPALRSLLPSAVPKPDRVRKKLCSPSPNHLTAPCLLQMLAVLLPGVPGWLLLPGQCCC
jgi:hypothetical protein